MRVRRLALLIPDLGIGGAEHVALRLMQDWVCTGHEVDLLLLRAQGELLPLLPPEVKVFNLKATRIRAAIWPLITYLRNRQPHAIQASMWPITILAIVARRIAASNARVVVSEHSVLSKEYARLSRASSMLLRNSIRFLYPLADARIAVSKGAADDLAKLSHIDRSSIEVIYSPVQQLSDARLANIEELWGGAKVRILTVGRLKQEKNQRLLIEAFAKLPSDRGAKLMLLGDGSLLFELRDLSLQLGVGSDVIFQPFDVDPGAYYRSANLFVLSSEYEGFGLVLVEALLSGLPIVSTDCDGGPNEILGNGEFGALVPCGNAEEFARAMVEALDRPRDEHRQVARGRLFSGAGSSDLYLKLMIGDCLGNDSTR